MKTIKQFLLIIFFVAFASNVFSTEKVKVRADSVRIKFEKAMLEVATFDLKKNTLKKADIRIKFNELLKAIEKIEIKTPDIGEQICISYSRIVEGYQNFGMLQLRTKKIESKTIVVKDDVLLDTDFGNIVFEVEDENYLIRLYLESIDDAQIVNSIDFANKLKEVDREIPESRRRTNIWFIENNSGSFNTYHLSDVTSHSLDVLELNAGIISGLVKNELVTGFNLRIGIGFGEKGIQKSRYFLDYEFVYDFSDHPENKSFTTNDFLSVGYERNLSLNPESAKWFGFSVGYLVNRNNNFFEENTFKLSLHKHFNSSISLKPEVYFNNFFKNVSPGIKVQVTF